MSTSVLHQRVYPKWSSFWIYFILNFFKDDDVISSRQSINVVNTSIYSFINVTFDRLDKNKLTADHENSVLLMKTTNDLFNLTPPK